MPNFANKFPCGHTKLAFEVEIHIVVQNQYGNTKSDCDNKIRLSR